MCACEHREESRRAVSKMLSVAANGAIVLVSYSTVLLV